jgi:Tfp pilus assembly protein PilV
MRAAIQRLRGRARLRDDAGFTLLEGIVSFVLFVAVMGAAMNAIDSSLSASHSSQQRVDAANVAQAFVAQARSNPQQMIVESGKQYFPAVGGGTKGNASIEKFTVLRYITFSAPDESQCTAGSTFTVNVLVYLGTSASGKFLARNDSVVACPPS